MNESEALEYETLSWVKKELDATLEHAKRALEACIGEDGDSAQIAEVKDALHQVGGTLQMVELYGAAMLAQEMTEVTQALADDAVAAREDAFEVLLRAIMQLPDYLEHVQAGNRDVPIVLLPLLNDLRTARRASLLSERVLFFPDLEAVEVPEAAASRPEARGPDVRGLARQSRHQYQLGLLGWFRERDVAASLQRLQQVLDRLHEASSETPTQRLWWTSGALVEALALDGLESSVTVKSLLGKVDREIKRLIDQGEAAFAQSIPEDLFKNILYYIACADAKGERVGEVKATYALADILPQEETRDAMRTRIAGPNAQLLGTVSEALREDLAEIKDTLEVFVSAQAREASELAPVSEKMRVVGDTLGMLGLGSARERVLAEAATVAELVDGNVGDQDATLVNTAGVMLEVEQAIGDYVASGALVPEAEHAATDESAHNQDLARSKARDRQLLRSVATGALEEMAAIKEAVSRFIASPADGAPLQELPTRLDSIAGALRMAGVDEVLALLEALHRYVATRLLGEQASPDLDELESFADAITSVEYFLESLGSRVREPEAILAVGYESMTRLGYPTTQAIVTAGPDIEPAEPPPSQPADSEAASQCAETGPDDTSQGPVMAEPADSTSQALTWLSPSVARPLHGESAHDAPAEAKMAQASSSALEHTEPPPPARGGPAAIGVSRDLKPFSGDTDDELMEVFLEEAEEEVANLNAMLPKWRHQQDEQALATMRRAFHTLKGSGRLVGAQIIGELAWAYENLLNRVLDKSIPSADYVYDTIAQATETLPQLIEQVKRRDATCDVDVFTLMDEAHAMSRADFQPEWVQKKKASLKQAKVS